jgi:hypothetical protein
MNFTLQDVYLHQQPWLFLWKSPRPLTQVTVCIDQQVVLEALMVRRRFDFFEHVEIARDLIRQGNIMPVQERRTMIREELAPLLVSLAQHPDVNLSKPKIKNFFAVLLIKFYEYSTADPSNASIYGTVIWFVAQRMRSLSCLQTPFKRRWKITALP